MQTGASTFHTTGHGATQFKNNGWTTWSTQGWTKNPSPTSSSSQTCCVTVSKSQFLKSLVSSHVKWQQDTSLLQNIEWNSSVFAGCQDLHIKGHLQAIHLIPLKTEGAFLHCLRHYIECVTMNPEIKTWHLFPPSYLSRGILIKAESTVSHAGLFCLLLETSF